MGESTTFFYLLFCAGTAYYAHKRGRNPVVWGLLAAFISPLLSIIILACMKDLSVEQRLTELDTRTDHLKQEVQYNQQFNDYRAQTMQTQIQDVRRQSDRALQQASRLQSKQLPPAMQNRSCSECGFAIAGQQKFCPNCGTAAPVPEMNVSKFQFSLICPLKAHITHIQNLLMQSENGQRIKEIEYLDVVTGPGMGNDQKKLIFVVSFYASNVQSTKQEEMELHKQLSTLVEQAGYQAVMI